MISRSVVTLRAKRRWPSCRRCTGELGPGQHESTAVRTIEGARFEVETFRCRCGRGREVRRSIS